MELMMPVHPNIAVAGTPGTGKTTLAHKLAASNSHLKVINLGAEAEARQCRTGYDSQLKAWIVDEDKLAEALAPELKAGGNIIDWMHADFWPLDGTINLVVILRASNATLYDRYKARAYVEEKIQHNLDCEIMNGIGAELEDYYSEGPEITIIELHGDTDEDMTHNLETINEWITVWNANIPPKGAAEQTEASSQHTKSSSP
ncbi:MAG: factor activating pos9 [Chrysothrix sp. TS-e1954]|nr:MAG: factor activating pos9 [Chrysothrix sp. TS-e1954]